MIQVLDEEAIPSPHSLASVSAAELRKVAGVSRDHSIEIHLLRVKQPRQVIDARKRQGGLRRLRKPRKHSCQSALFPAANNSGDTISQAICMTALNKSSLLLKWR